MGFLPQKSLVMLFDYQTIAERIISQQNGYKFTFTVGTGEEGKGYVGSYGSFWNFTSGFSQISTLDGKYSFNSRQECGWLSGNATIVTFPSSYIGRGQIPNSVTLEIDGISVELKREPDLPYLYYTKSGDPFNFKSKLGTVITAKITWN